jgi:hypothetical protein
MRRSSAQDLAIESRRSQVAELFLRGVKRQGELARQVGVDRSTVSRDLKVLNARWKESGVRDLDAAKGQELDRLDQLEREYWDAWQKSKGPHEVTTTEQTTGGDGERARAAIRTEEQHGDPRYLAGVQWCIEQRCKLLGLNAPQKIAPTTPDGREPFRLTVEDLTQARARAEEWRRERIGLPGPGTN